MNLKSRWRQHKHRLNAGNHGNAHLQNAWEKYGEDKFRFWVLCFCHKDLTLEYEQRYLDEMQPEYNLAKDVTAPMRGRNHTEKTKRKLSELHKGKPLSEEHKQKLSESLKGAKSPNYGKHLSEETKWRMSESLKGTKNPFYGKRHSEETKRKMSESRRGKNNPSYGKKPGNWINFTEEEMEKMKVRRESGASYREIAKVFNVSHNTIKSRLAKPSGRHLAREDRNYTESEEE